MHIVENDPGTPDGEGGWLEEPDPEYDLFMISNFASSTQTYLYEENANALYQHLLDEGIYVGVIA